MAWWLTGDDHANRIFALIQRLMLLASGNFDSFMRVKDKMMMFDFQGQLPFQNVEELACMDVRMSGLTCAGWHKFFDNAEVWRFDEVPAVAVSSLLPAPSVMFGRCYADYVCRH
jgi:hypothetical protein